MSILWSEGTAAFEPIHLEGDFLTPFEQAARRGRQVLAENPNAANDLVEIGRDLHRLFFAGPVGSEVAAWLRGLGTVESFEIGSDAPEEVPFALFDDPDQPGPWGKRFPLVVRGRINPPRIDRPRPLPDAPYHPLRPLEREDRALLFGRDDDIEACALALGQPNVAGFLIHGRAGVGKASLVRAGLLPFLEDDNRSFYVLRDRTDPGDELDQPTLALRTGPDLAGSLIMGLTAFAARPFTYTTPTGRTVTVDLPAILFGSASETAIQPSPTDNAWGEPVPRSPAAVWDKVRDNPGQIAELFDRVTRDLPFDLLIPLEQLEDVVTLPTSQTDVAAVVLNAFAKSPGQFHVVATLRTEYLGEVRPLLGDDGARGAWKDYFLDALPEDAVNDALLAPTKTELPYAEGSPAAVYELTFEPGTVTSILAYVKEQIRTSGYSAIQLVQAFGEELFEANRSTAAVRKADVDRIVKKGAVDALFDRKLKALGVSSADAIATRNLITGLHRAAGGVVTRDLVAVDSIEHKWRSKAPAQQILNVAVERGPLLEAHNMLINGKERLYVALPQDLLANYGDQQERLKGNKKYARSKVMDSAFLYVPLTVLAMAIAFFLISRSKLAGQKAELEAARKEGLQKGFQEGREKGATDTRFAVYSGALAQANELIHQGNTLRARQWLATQQPQGPDIRGFEWYYLWKKINGEEANLLGHKALVTTLAMSPDGKSLASGDEEGNVLLWNLEDLKEPLVANLKGLKKAVQSLAFAPDGNAVAGTDGDTQAVIWSDFKPGKSVADLEHKTTLNTSGKGAICVSFFDNGSVAVGNEDASVTLYDVAEKKTKWTGSVHSAPVKALVALTGGKLVSASDKELIAWSSEGKKLSSLEIKGKLAGIAKSPSGDSVVILGSRFGVGSVNSWSPNGDMTNVSASAELPDATAIAVVPGAKLIAAAGADQVIRLMVDVPGAKLQNLVGHVSAVRSLAGGGTKLASVGYDNAIKIWDLNKAPASSRLAHSKSGAPVVGLALDESGRILASAGDRSIVFWDPTTDRQIGKIELKEPMSSIAFSAKSNPLLLAAGVGNDVSVWEVSLKDDAVETKDRATLKKHTGPVTCVVFDTESNKFLASGSEDKTAIVWDVAAAKDKATLPHAAAPQALYLDEVMLYTGDAAGEARTWFIPQGKTIAPPSQVHNGAFTALMPMGIKGKGLVSSGLDQAVRNWGIDPTGKLVMATVWRAHHQPVTALAQGKGFFATGAADGSVKTWDPTLTDERFTFQDHKGPIRALAISKKNDLLASAGNDGTIVVRRGVAQPNGFPFGAPPTSRGEPADHDED